MNLMQALSRNVRSRRGQARFREKGGVKLSSTYSTNEMETKDSIGKGEVILNQRQKVDA
jgi:hypothetical protein